VAEHNATFEVFYDGAWHPAPVLTGGGFRVMRGVKTPGNDTDPAEGGLTIDNTSGLWAPKSVLSPLYGKIGQNTPGRASLDGDVRMTGEVASWKPQRPVKGSGYTPIELGGVLRRIGRGTDPLRSPLTRAILGLDPTAFWPLDDPTTATQFASAVAGGTPMSFTDGVLPGEYEDLPGMARAADPRTGSISGVVDLSLVATHADVTWTGGFAMKVNDVPLNDALDSEPLVTFYTGGSYYQWEVWLLVSSLGDITLSLRSDQGFDRTYSNHPISADLFDGTWHMYEFGVRYLTSTNAFTVTTVIDGTVVDTASDVATTTVTTCGVRTVDVNALRRDFGTPFGIGAVYARNGSAPATYAGAAAYGYAGETAADRFSRLCAEEGITAVVVGSAAESVAMGPQGTSPLLAQFDEIARTDDASIFETRDALSLTMRTGTSKMNQTPALSVSYLGQVQPPLRPVFGDQGIRNDVTARNPDGSAGRVVQETGRHNVQLPEDDPHGVGRYSTDLDVNTAEDTQLVDAAGWRVGLGTFDGTWYATVTVDLDAAPGLVAAVNAVDIGDVVAITELPVEDSIGTFLGIVLGIEDDAPPKRRLVTFYLAAADPYRVGILAATTGDTDPTIGYAETDDTTTAAPVAAGAASFTANASPLWTTLADDFPQDVVVGGQRVTLASVTGASNPQTFNVRSAALGGRQVVYPIPAGADVWVYQPLILT
jgi:hypothetical protein